MKCQSLFSEKNKKNILKLLSAEFVHRVVKAELKKGTEEMGENIV